MTAQVLTAAEMLEKLVAFDTTSAKTNIPLIEFVEVYLSSHGVESHRVPTQDGRKSSLHAVIGPKDVPGFGLSGHTDVVPVEGQDWTSDPFTLTKRGSRLFGRGTCDMKGFVASSPMSRLSKRVTSRRPFTCCCPMTRKLVARAYVR